MVTNENNDVTFSDGLHVWNNYGLKESDGYYFYNSCSITKEYLHGIYLREVLLPSDDAEFQLCYNEHTGEYKANKIILGKRYLLSDMNTHILFV